MLLPVCLEKTVEGASKYNIYLLRRIVHYTIRVLTPTQRMSIVYYFSTLRAGSSISHTLGKKRVLKIELPTRRIKKLCTIHVRKRDSRLVCLSTLASLGCKHHTRRKSTFPHFYRNVLFPIKLCKVRAGTDTCTRKPPPFHMLSKRVE